MCYWSFISSFDTYGFEGQSGMPLLFEALNECRLQNYLSIGALCSISLQTFSIFFFLYFLINFSFSFFFLPEDFYYFSSSSTMYLTKSHLLRKKELGKKSAELLSDKLFQDGLLWHLDWEVMLYWDQEKGNVILSHLLQKID